MTRTRPIAAALLAGSILFAGGGMARACTWMPPLDLTTAAWAEQVFEGEVISFEAVYDGPSYISHAIVRFRVVEMLKGAAMPEITLLMFDNLVGVPERWRWGERVIVATAPAGIPDITSRSDTDNPDPGLPVLMHPPCGTPFIAPADAATRAVVEAAIAAP